MSMTPTPDSINLTTPSGPLAAWSTAVAASVHTIAPGGPDPFAWACAPWCASGPDHPATTVPEDRACSAEPATVPLAHHRGGDARSSGDLEPALAVVSLRQRHDAAEPTVELGRISYAWESGRGAVPALVEITELTPTEARALAALLVTAAAAATTGDER